LVVIVLMQRPKQEGLGAAFASGMMSESFGAQATDVLQKGTRNLAIAFFALSIGLAVLKAQDNRQTAQEPSLLEDAGESTDTPTGADLIDELPGADPETPEASEEEETPAEPTVPGLESMIPGLEETPAAVPEEAPAPETSEESAAASDEADEEVPTETPAEEPVEAPSAP
ncbi:MAG: preprotein translocase subunit SecG, partial [Verrucomicrobiota bacterium]